MEGRASSPSSSLDSGDLVVRARPGDPEPFLSYVAAGASSSLASFPKRCLYTTVTESLALISRSLPQCVLSPTHHPSANIEDRLTVGFSLYYCGFLTSQHEALWGNYLVALRRRKQLHNSQHNKESLLTFLSLLLTVVSTECQIYFKYIKYVHDMIFVKYNFQKQMNTLHNILHEFNTKTKEFILQWFLAVRKDLEISSHEAKLRALGEEKSANWALLSL